MAMGSMDWSRFRHERRTLVARTILVCIVMDCKVFTSSMNDFFYFFYEAGGVLPLLFILYINKKYKGRVLLIFIIVPFTFNYIY